MGVVSEFKEFAVKGIRCFGEKLPLPRDMVEKPQK